jgi:predicted Rossmann-fold nucleotide-binding protein
MKAIVAVIGGGSCTTEETALAEETGRLLASQGAVVVCGGLGGVMEAVARGAKANGGMTVGILPGADPAAANAYIGGASRFLQERGGYSAGGARGGRGALGARAHGRRGGIIDE